MSDPHVALMRGINVGGKNKLPMKELRALFEAAGCDAVRTYVQSGNVVFRADAGSVDRLATEVTDRIAANFGYRIPGVLRSAAELRSAAGAESIRGRRRRPQASSHRLLGRDTG